MKVKEMKTKEVISLIEREIEIYKSILIGETFSDFSRGFVKGCINSLEKVLELIQCV